MAGTASCSLWVRRESLRPEEINRVILFPPGELQGDSKRIEVKKKKWDFSDSSSG